MPEDYDEATPKRNVRKILDTTDLNYLNENNQNTLLEKMKEVERMLMALIKSLENKL